MKTLIIYATKYGTTKKAAEKLKDIMPGEVLLINIMEQEVPSLDNYDNVILGGSIYVGKIQDKLTSYINSNLQSIIKKRVGLFICCAQKDSNTVMKEFQDSFPAEIYSNALAKEVFGYGFHFESMGLFEKIIVGLIMGIKASVSELNEASIKKLADSMCF